VKEEKNMIKNRKIAWSLYTGAARPHLNKILEIKLNYGGSIIQLFLVG